MASKSEEEFRKLTVELRFLEQTAETIQSRLNMINAVITDLTYSSMTLEDLGKEKEDAELLVPVGGSSYVKARLGNTDKLIVGIGAGVSVEKALPEAKEVVKKRLEDLDKARMSLQQQFSQVVDKINEDRAKIEAQIAEMREGNPSVNV
ncbi:prefoldin subunit alpha [Candidatus Bathyarchaeota archaeon RBG_13_46_16b]|nr:MAG: prefoldin subunit alpha [Candidatus Bathyarchaeota archaeon RBG_13_46_16b]